MVISLTGQDYFNAKVTQVNDSFILAEVTENVSGAISVGTEVSISKKNISYELAIDYNKNDIVDFIEFLGGAEGSLQPTIYGVSAFGSDAEEVTELLKQKNDGEITDTEQGYFYSFSNISVGVYREIRPSDILEMIEAMKADGIPTEDNEDLATDMRRANHWATIGVGVDGYYQW